MSEGGRRGLGLSAALFMAALAQMVWADAMTIKGAKPDFLVAAALLSALFCDANGGAAVGFFAGLLQACLASPPHGGFGSLIVSATLVGFGVGWLEERVFRDNALFAVGVVAVGTALQTGLFFIFAPQHHLAHWLHGAATTTLYNTLLALPLYFLVRAFAGKRRDT